MIWLILSDIQFVIYCISLFKLILKKEVTMFTENKSTFRLTKLYRYFIILLFSIFPDLLFSQLPEFGLLDAGQMPICLIEISPNVKTAGWIVNANTAYTVWTAPKVKNQQYYDAAWKTFGPYTFAGQKRYIFSVSSGELSDNVEITGTTTKLSPGLASLHVENSGSINYWIIVNPIPPGCGNMGEYESGNISDPKSNDPGKENTGSISGKYKLNANNYKGFLEINADFTGGRVYFDISKNWESIENLTYDSATGEIFFTRPWQGNPMFQQYKGKVSGSKITGTFTDNNSPGQNFPWEAEK